MEYSWNMAEIPVRVLTQQTAMVLARVMRDEERY